METKLQLKHPVGKKATAMSKDKYDTLKEALLKRLVSNGPSTHAEILEAIAEDFRNSKTTFEGSLNWHLEWVKLDLEARKAIRRIGEKSRARFALGDSLVARHAGTVRNR